MGSTQQPDTILSKKPTEEPLQESLPQEVTLVLPAYNEAESLSVLLPGLLDYLRKMGWQLIVVDDGSSDATGEVLSAYKDNPGLQVIRHKLNRGYGGALKSGLRAASTEFVVTMDADGQHRHADIERLLFEMLNADADMVIGQRGKDATPSRYRRLGKWLIRTLTRILVPNSIKDLNSGFKMYRTALVQQYLPLCPDSMAFSDVITLVFIKRRHLVIEVPIEAEPRQGGVSTINTYTALDTVFEILNIIMLFNPMRIFMPIAVLCLLFGFLWGLPILYLGRGVSVGSMLAIVTGLIFMFLGLVAEQLSKIRLQSIDRITPSGSPKSRDPR